ncbi:MAG: alpha/beta fold hydrolase [Alphaproteobacteria bacterium]|nr:alpha/beta fold hydrolase [Alphaproteobacteria bacterium]
MSSTSSELVHLKPQSQPSPFGRAWVRAIVAETETRITGGELFTGKAGRDRPLIVGLPGALCSTKDLRAIARALTEHFDLLLVDMPEYGNSRSKSHEPPQAELYARHVIDIVEAAAPSRDIIFLGQSMGAIVAMAAAVGVLRQRTRAIVMLDPPISQRALRGVQQHLLNYVNPVETPPFVFSYVEDSDFVNSVHGDGHWALLGKAARAASIAVLAGDDASGRSPEARSSLIDAKDEARLLALDPPDLVFRRFPEAGHSLLVDARDVVTSFIIQYCLWNISAPPGQLRRICEALAERPADIATRDALVLALADVPANSQSANREIFLRLIERRPDDAELARLLMKAGYSLPDRQAIGTFEHICARAVDPAAVAGAHLQIANAHSTIGDVPAARSHLERAHALRALPPAIETTLAAMRLYDPATADLDVAAAKAERLARLRAVPEIAGPALALGPRGARARVGFASATVGSRNYLSLAVPLLRELAGADFSVDLISLTDADVAMARAVLPREIGINRLATMDATTLGNPAAWRRTAEALAAEPYDLLIDMDESLLPHTPGSFVLRPGHMQATWFNMTGPSEDPCYDFAVGPAPIYPDAMARAFPGRIEATPGDIYVYEPEVWASPRSPLPWPGLCPEEHSGHVTFGSLSNPYKISRECFALWAKVLRAVPGSRLYLGNNLAGEPLFRERIWRMAAEESIGRERILLRHHFGWPNYLVGYREIDIVLGTLPVAGGMTMFEAVHLGLPVLSRVGNTSLGRIGRWLAQATGRPGIAHDSDETFVAEAVRLAGAVDERIALRRDEPRRLRAKSRVDAIRMAEAFADIVRRRVG